MKKNPIEQLFNRLGGELNGASPSADHKANFLKKLEAQKIEPTSNEKKASIQWMRPLFIAASLVLLVGLIFSQISTSDSSRELADVSPEMQETQDFFTKAIERELFDIKENVTPENAKIVQDAIKRIKILETDYNRLKNDLSESGEDKRVIYAMIDNFQNRIDLLQEVVAQMEAIKQLKTIEEKSIL